MTHREAAQDLSASVASGLLTPILPLSDFCGPQEGLKLCIMTAPKGNPANVYFLDL